MSLETLLEEVCSEEAVFILAFETVGVDLVTESLQAKSKKRENVVIKIFI